MSDLTGGPANAAQGDAVSRLTALARIASALNACGHLPGLTAVVTTDVAETLGAVAVSLSVLVTPTTLKVVGICGDTDGVTQRGARFPLDTDNPVPEAARTGLVVAVSGREAVTERYPTLPAGQQGERSVVALPLLVAGACLGVIGLAFDRRLELDDVETAFLGVVADTCAQALARIFAQRAEHDRLTQLSFLLTATDGLAASLNYEVTLQRLADLVVPGIATWCVIDLLDDGALRPVAVAHEDPEKVALALHMRKTYPPNTSAPSGAHVVARTGVPEIWEDVDPDLLRAAAQDEEHLRLVLDLDLRSAILVPLTTGARTLGVLTLVRTGDSRRYSRDDLGFAQELARRAAVAIDNAELHSQTLEASLQLQRAVLPTSFTGIRGWEIAVEYRPAGRTAVGGDFYDAIPLPDGRLVAFVGDVMGRGVTAAAAMAQVRSALRAYVALDPSPVTVLDRLSTMFEALDLPQLVTVLYAVVDPRAGAAELLSIGHLPPLLIDRQGRVTRLVVPSSPPLGAGRFHREATTVPVAPGDTLLLFTDGLVERRGEDLDAGLDRLLVAAGSLHGDVTDGRLLAIADELRLAGHDDDVTLLAVRSASAQE